jgi:hypothetical protein|tara:strand:+ start:1509 stop:1778 length:270 start_codon:yes stop_codon:yes gene_type:complete
MNDALLTKFILSFLVEKDDYKELSQQQQQLVYETCKTIMKAIYNAIKYDNVYPVIMCGDVEAKTIIEKAINSVLPTLPSTDKITVSLIH